MTEPRADLELPGGRSLPGRLLSVRFARSGGPGGQNVNKVESKVDLRLDLDGAIEVLGAVIVTRLREMWQSRLDGDGCLQVVCDEHRSQARNVDTARERLIQLLAAGLVRPKTRRKTRPTRGSVERRIAGKRRRSDVKQNRKRPDRDS